jgi:hypothetical protein
MDYTTYKLPDNDSAESITARPKIVGLPKPKSLFDLASTATTNNAPGFQALLDSLKSSEFEPRTDSDEQ